jgi:hypothetical protein
MQQAKGRVGRGFPTKRSGGTAPNPVMRLWTACTGLKTQWVTDRDFRLTLFLEGVKKQSFFDSFLSFSGWCGVRGSSQVT